MRFSRLIPAYENRTVWRNGDAILTKCVRTQSGEQTTANEGYHEPIDELSDETRDMHRAITSLMEELEGFDV